MLAVCAQKQAVQVKSAVKDSHWYDVGIVKVTNMVVSHYYVPYDAGMIDVSASIFFFFFFFKVNFISQICHTGMTYSITEEQ